MFGQAFDLKDRVTVQGFSGTGNKGDSLRVQRGTEPVRIKASECVRVVAKDVVIVSVLEGRKLLAHMTEARI